MLNLLQHQVERAEQVLSRSLFDYYAGGSGLEITVDEAERAWQAYRLRPSVLRDVSTVSVGTTLLGRPVRTPIGVAPCASHGLVTQAGEVATAEGAAAAGALLILSTRASRRIEDVAAVGAEWWMQIYVTRDRALTAGLVRRAAAAGASALVLTGDTPFVAPKARRGRPAALRDPSALVNLGEHLAPGVDPSWAAEQDPSITFETIGWLAELSGLPVFVKGVLRADDARRCVDSGAAGLIVSNHGGRQLDRAVPSALALPDVVAAAADVPVLVDGGIRSGTDALVALALGARAVLVGRPTLWALATDGAAGVGTMLDALTHDLSVALALLGARDLGELESDHVVRV